MSQPWYRKGLKFACVGCGACCTGVPGYVWVDRAEIKTLAATVGVEVEEFRRRYVRPVSRRTSLIELVGGDCVFFDSESRGCRVYRARPRQCHTWPFWPSNLATPAAWDQTARRCPGCNRGWLASLEKILAQLEKKDVGVL